MVHWVYVLECDDDYIYVGETTRLFTRFSEHLGRHGCSNTSKHRAKRLVGLYKVGDNHSFINYREMVRSGEYDRFAIGNWDTEGDHLLVENHITQRLFYERRENDSYGGGMEWYKVRGGKYTKKTWDEIVDMYKYGRGIASNPVRSIPEDLIVDRPLCKCYYPSEVKLSEDGTKIYFVCAIKNVWPKFHSQIDVDTPCDFWQLYTEDEALKADYEVVKERSKEPWVRNVPVIEDKYQLEPCSSCMKKEYIPVWHQVIRQLCQTCILKKYDSLKEQYKKVYAEKQREKFKITKGVCMITDEI